LYGIKSRKQGSTELAKPNPASGERRYSNRVVKNHKELEVIGLILKLHNSGNSFRSIARILNKMGVATRQGVGSWHHWVIREIAHKNSNHKD
ncbi:MAG: hypothetical protein AAF203_04685, partial [Pseudomonadota bacterium]